MIFLRVNITFYEAVKTIHDVLITPDLHPQASKFVYCGVLDNKDQQIPH